MQKDEEEVEHKVTLTPLIVEEANGGLARTEQQPALQPSICVVPSNTGGLPASQSKLDGLPREDLIRLVKKQLMGLNNAKKQIELHKKEAEEKDKKIEYLLSNKSSSEYSDNKEKQSAALHAADMISMELSDYKKGLETVKEQLKHSQSQLAARQEMIDQLTLKIESVTEEKEHLQNTLKQANAEASTLRASMEEKSIVISENSKEIDSLVVQMSQIKSAMEGEINSLNQTILRQKQRLVEEQRQDGTKAAEIRRLKADNEIMQRRLDDLEQEHRTFKERAQYVLKQQTNEENSEGNKQNNSVEVQQLIETLTSRNDKISQLTARCSFLSEEVHIGQEHIKNLQAELEEINQSILIAQNRDQMERRTFLAGHEQRIRQMHDQLDKLREDKKALEEKYELDKSVAQRDFNQRFEQLLSQNQKLSDALHNAKAVNRTPNSSNIFKAQTHEKSPPYTSAIIHRQCQLPLSKHTEHLQYLKDPASDENSEGGHNSESESLASDDMLSLQSALNGNTDPEHNELGSRGLAPVFSAYHNGDEEDEKKISVDDIKAQLNYSRELLADVEENNVKLMEQVKILKEEIRRLERNNEREFHIKNSGEYFKNIMLKFLAPEKVSDERQQLLPVLKTMLRLSVEECEEVEKCIISTPVIQAKQEVETAKGGDWTGYFGSLAGIF